MLLLKVNNMNKIFEEQKKELDEIFVTLVRMNDDEGVKNFIEMLDELIIGFGLTQAK